MSSPPKVFILLLTGNERDALAFAQRRYPGCETAIVSKTELRESNWKTQLQKLRQLKGEAFLIFTESLQTTREPLLLKWTVLVHGCRETVLADSAGAFEASSKEGLFSLLPKTLLAAVADLMTLAFTGLGLIAFQTWLKLKREPEARASQLDLAFLYPSQGGLNVPGGALTHVTGFLSGIAKEGAQAIVLAGQPLKTVCEVRPILGSHRLHLFFEAAALSYNLRFTVAARKLLAKKRPRLLYQRHGRFQFAGALLSRVLGIPLVLEYNGSEVWIAKHWDPGRFLAWLRLCEKVSVKAASLIVVVSKALKQALMEVGVPEERILINPNAVDPEIFHPGCGGEELRNELGLHPQDIVVCFVGTFSYWHGVEVLERAIRMLLQGLESTGEAGPLEPSPLVAGPPAPPLGSLKFLLVGDGLLAAQLRGSLEPYARQGSVIFTGAVPHRSVRAYLDAADILVSPHVPNPSGDRFFGSPTKLFEYMAMGKAIAASALDQIAEVLEDGKTALLVCPGDAVELAAAIQRLAADAQLRAELGHNARASAMARHTWRQNARRVLESCEGLAQARLSAARRGSVPHRTDAPQTELVVSSVPETISHGRGSRPADSL